MTGVGAPVWAVAPVAAVVAADFGFSALAFVASYVWRQHTPAFLWSTNSSLPIGIAREFQPYFVLLLFVPVVKLIALHRYGLYKLRGEFSFSGDFIRVFKASTIALMLKLLA